MAALTARSPARHRLDRLRQRRLARISFVANGAVNIVEAQRRPAVAVQMRNQLFHNPGRPAVPKRPSAPRAPPRRAPEISRGCRIRDIDNDGDVDIVVTNNNGPVRLLLNQRRRAATGCRCVSTSGPATGREIGALVGVERAGHPTLWRRVRTDGSYLSASDVRVHFGLGSSPSIGVVTVSGPTSARALEKKPASPATDW